MYSESSVVPVVLVPLQRLLDVRRQLRTEAVALGEEVRERRRVLDRTSERSPAGCVSAYSCARNPPQDWPST